MSLSVLKVSCDAVYQPKVVANGLSLSISEAPFEHSGKKGVAEATVIDFAPGDAGKFFYVSLVLQERSGSDDASYHLIVQDRTVNKPMIPELDANLKVMFQFVSGSVSDDGQRIDAVVRHFHR